MGQYFNPDNVGFKKTANSKIYVDKTSLILEMNKWLNTEANCIAVSHARRFGKSQAARMLEAYYSRGCDSRSLFESFAIGKQHGWDKYLNQFNVIHLDMTTFVNKYEETLVESLTKTLYRELKEVYPKLLDITEPFASIMGDVYAQTGIPFIIIIDEWDCVIRNYADKPKYVHAYMQFLHDLFKSEEAKSFLALGYITGILPIKKIKDESALNNFMEFTMLSSQPITQFYGFTKEEVETLCQKYELDFASVCQWYDGYLLDKQHMYNPNSVCTAIIKQKIDSYWKNTSAYEGINTYIMRNFEGLKDDVVKMLDGVKVQVNVSPFKNDLSEINSKDDALTALIHLGYLSYDELRKQAFIPNYEVKAAFRDALTTGKWQDIKAILDRCDELLTATWDQDSDKVAEIIELAHQNHASVLQYNNENALSCVVTMAYFTAPAYYTITRELPAGKGFVDLAFIPRSDSGDVPAFLVELKWDESAATAVQQIKQRNYPASMQGYKGKLLLVGISYNKDVQSKDYKTHYCRIEEIYIEQ